MSSLFSYVLFVSAHYYFNDHKRILNNMNTYQNIRISNVEIDQTQQNDALSDEQDSVSVEKGSLNNRQTVSNGYVLGIAFYSFFAFTLVQTVFAVRARSSAMVADSVAMFVDAFTYLFNLLAEHLKDCDHVTDYERRLPPPVRLHRKKLQTLYLELFPPLISVSTLLVVTVLTLRSSISTLTAADDDVNVDPNLSIMMFFSVVNLVIDCINVTCFARAEKAVQFNPSALDIVSSHHKKVECTEISHLLVGDQTTASDSMDNISIVEDSIACDDDLSYDGEERINQGRNLNMCSAFTVSSLFP